MRSAQAVHPNKRVRDRKRSKIVALYDEFKCGTELEK